MNKLDGMYELRKANLPSVDWKEFRRGTILPDDYLWTIRTAVYKGQDIHLPRLFGKPAGVSMRFAEQCLEQMKGKGIIICYPYLQPEKSGVLQFDLRNVYLEGISGDVKKILDGDNPEVFYQWREAEFRTQGKSRLFSEQELMELYRYSQQCKRRYREILSDGSMMQLEFSYAYRVDRDHNKCEDTKLYFFEMRTI